MTLHKLFKQFLLEQTQVADNTKVTMTRIMETFPTPTKLDEDWLRTQSTVITPSTLRSHRSLALRFLKWWAKKDKTKKTRIQERIEDMRDVKLPKVKKSVTVEDLYSSEELASIFKAAKHTRDIALVQVLYESAFRASELLSMTFRRVKFHDDGTATIIINGKTGTREIPLYRSVPVLKTWMNIHPTQEGPIWTVLKHKKHNALNYDALYFVIQQMLLDTGLLKEKKRIIHMFRHTRATELVRLGVRGIPLQKFMGWRGGDMEQVYIHLSTLDVNNEIRSKVFGIDPVSEQPKPLLSIAKCPRCHTNNDDGAMVCIKCNMPLSNDAIIQQLTERESIQERMDILEKMVLSMAEKLEMDPSVFGLALPAVKKLPKKE
ncbi:MAG: tyrosine-type recombinase/integrase [Candidatus Thorarchaeota archaeon]|nr:tyrosine-type recombinase/integrase [Candidatus Thorarchaeota archaeon]MCK5239248.1 tyrosine-type recombinase/integrase [Candidatus Thorarchaeota archaeon]